MPQASTATVTPPAASAARCAAPSMPSAPPDTTVQPRSARPWARSPATYVAVLGGGAGADDRHRAGQCVVEAVRAADPQRQRRIGVAVGDLTGVAPADPDQVGEPGCGHSSSPGQTTRTPSRSASSSRRSPKASHGRHGSSGSPSRVAAAPTRCSETRSEHSDVGRHVRPDPAHDLPELPVAGLDNGAQADVQGSVRRSSGPPSQVECFADVGEIRERRGRRGRTWSTRRRSTRLWPRAEIRPRSRSFASGAVAARGSRNRGSRSVRAGTAGVRGVPPRRGGGAGPRRPAPPPPPTTRRPASPSTAAGRAGVEHHLQVDPVEQRAGQPAQVPAAGQRRALAVLVAAGLRARARVRRQHQLHPRRVHHLGPWPG